MEAFEEFEAACRGGLKVHSRVQHTPPSLTSSTPGFAHFPAQHTTAAGHQAPHQTHITPQRKYTHMQEAQQLQAAKRNLERCANNLGVMYVPHTLHDPFVFFSPLSFIGIYAY